MSGILEDWAYNRLVIVGKSGDELVVECPWCSRPKLYLSIRRKRYLCFRGCSQGAVARLVAHVDGISLKAAGQKLDSGPRTATDLADAISRLRRGHRNEPPDPPQIPLPPEFVPCFDGEWWRVPRYVATRGISERALIRHGIGYARRGRYRDRLIVPIVFGEYRAFIARLMGSPQARAWVTREGKTVTPPRYLTPRDAEIGRAIFWGDRVEAGDDVIVVEGVFDAIRLIDLGFVAVATLGKRTTTEQLGALVHSGASSLTWLYDSDAVTSSMTEAAKAASLAATGKLTVFVAELPDGYDPDDFGREAGRGGVLRVLEKRVEINGPLAPLRLTLSRLLEM